MAGTTTTKNATEPPRTTPVAAASTGSAAGDLIQPRAGRVLAVTAGVAFLAFLDVTVVNLAFPNLRHSFPNSTVADLSWVITGYAVPFAALLSPAGRLADGLGRRRLLLVGIAVFVAASLASALAPGVDWLAMFRAVQGAGAAVMLPAALGQVLSATPPERRAAAVGIWGASAGMAAAAGPALGGVLVDTFDWRAVFLINVPLGVLLILVGRRVLVEVRVGPRQVPDPVGTLFLVAGLSLVVLGISKGIDWGWTSATVLTCLALGPALTLTALRLASSHPVPALETRLWQIRPFAAANLTSLLVGASFYAWLLLGVLYLTSVWHYSELLAGLAVTPGALTAAVASAMTGRRTGLRGQRIAVVAGCAVLAAGALVLYFVLGARHEFLAVWLPAGLVSGAAIGAVFTGLSSAAALSVPPEKFAAATGLNLTARQLGGALGVAGLAVILQSQAHLGVRAFLDVYLLCAAAAAAAAISGLRLTERRDHR